MHRCVVEYANLVMKKVSNLDINIDICKIVDMCRDGHITTFDAMTKLVEIEINTR